MPKPQTALWLVECQLGCRRETSRGVENEGFYFALDANGDGSLDGDVTQEWWGSIAMGLPPAQPVLQGLGATFAAHKPLLEWRVICHQVLREFWVAGKLSPKFHVQGWFRKCNGALPWVSERQKSCPSPPLPPKRDIRLLPSLGIIMVKPKRCVIQSKGSKA